MFQLILTVLAIALTGSLIAISINVAPTWLPAFHRAEPVLLKGFCRLEQAADAEILKRKRVPKAQEDRSDGGLAPLFGARYTYLPAALPGSEWRFGTRKIGKRMRGYICLDASQTGLNEGSYRALHSLAKQLPPGQFVWGGQCGQGKSVRDVEAYPVMGAATLYLTPGHRVLSGLPGCK